MQITTWEFEYIDYEYTVDLRVRCHFNHRGMPFVGSGGSTVSRESIEIYRGTFLSLLVCHIENMIEQVLRHIGDECGVQNDQRRT